MINNFQQPLLRPNPIQTVELDSAASSRSPKMIGFFLFARPIWDVFSVLLKLWDSIHVLDLKLDFILEFERYIISINLHYLTMGSMGRKRANWLPVLALAFPVVELIQHLQELKPPTDVHSEATAARWHTTVEARAAWGPWNPGRASAIFGALALSERYLWI